MIRFYNTLAAKVEPFETLEPERVKMYSCGPTVHDFAHIGNFRTFVFEDILRRFLQHQGYELLQVRNLTDVDDKTIRKSLEAGISLREYTDKFAQAFLEDARLLNLEPPERLVRATEHIDDMVKLIERLRRQSFTYESEGSTYFRISKFPGYGKLSKIDLSGIKTGARVEADSYEKEDPRDFALWKAPKENEPFWETALGRGRPGWHIECSAMSMRYLGESFDIHTGGVDLAFPHHENEIAQSEAATGRPFVRYWLHGEHLLVEGEKMSKSLGNFYSLRDLFARGYRPSAIRYLLASVPYRKQLNFTFDGLQQAAGAVDRLRNFRFRLTTSTFPGGSQPRVREACQAAGQEVFKGLADDLNTAQALAAIFDLVRDVNTIADQGEFRSEDVGPVLEVLAEWDKIFAVMTEDDSQKLKSAGYAPTEAGEEISAGEVERLIQERAQARSRRDFAAADRIRQDLLRRGILIEDTKDGVRWRRE